MQELKPATMPLYGTRLIEASAGTGKTYTITSLYLRALLGLRQGSGEQYPAFDQPDTGLGVEQILVVTFTEAATEEIRDRVRRQLLAAKQAIFYRDSPAEQRPAVDPGLAEILGGLTDQERGYQRLDAAIKLMDEAAIFTIHGFCHRMLTYHAFESGSLFQQEMVLDQHQYLLTGIKDFWRSHIYPLNDTMLSLCLAHWRMPEQLLADIKPLIGKSINHLDLNHLESPPDGQSLEQLVTEYQGLVDQVKQQWQAEQLPVLIAEAGLIKNRKPAKPQNLQAFSEFCATDQLQFQLGKDSWELWSSAAIAKATKKAATPLQHQIFAYFDRLVELQTTLDQQIKIYFKQQALSYVEQRMAVAKAQARQLSPDDLLTQMADAVQDPIAGKVLIKRIAKQYPLAMIDEFQDTDPLQYQIFSGIYQSSEASLVMIGDPKQAIYGFRGADIFTYIQAKTDIDQQQQYTLATNWRSASSLVNAVNGVFRFRSEPFIYDDSIPFCEVNAANKVAKTPLLIDGEPGAALQLWQLCSDDQLPLSKQIAHQQLAEHCSEEIADLLNKAQLEQAKIGDRCLQAGDICILVRDRNQAKIIRDALNSRGISSVFLSRQSVFDTQLAEDFYLLLQAIYQQHNDKAIRAALLGCFFRYDLQDLWQLTTDEQSWQQVWSDFSYMNQLWERHGVMAILHYLFNQQDLAGQWQANYQFPERMLTDIRHLGELLQHKSLELDGTHRLLHWFQQQLLAAQNSELQADKTQQLRLDSDSDLVQIVTMHAAKGLEYPLVFIPFASDFRRAQQAIYHDQQQHSLVVDFADQPANLERADQERLAEDLRLLYVALTRGIYRCYLGISNQKVGNSKTSVLADSAIGYLLLNGVAGQDQGITQQLQQLKQQLNQQDPKSCELTLLCGEPSSTVYQSGTQSDAIHHNSYVLRRFAGEIHRNWQITSYTALSYGLTSVEVLPGATDEGVELSSLPIEAVNHVWDRFSFPKGANAGSCLHQMLEQLPFDRLRRRQLEPAAQQQILSDLQHYGIDLDWQQPVIDWLADVVATPWSAQGPCLADLSARDCLVELEFYLAMDEINAEQINQILSLHLGREVHDFAFKPVVGVLKGFIDLCVQWQGQYYVVDHKSNHLGHTIEDYQITSIERAMDEHHYHLQYLLYSLALHRFLGLRLEDYDYEQHFGGCYYLFLRGMSEQNLDHQGCYFSRPAFAVIQQLDQLFTDGSSLAATPHVAPQSSLFGDR